MKKQKGITLIALVITIIVMLILVVVTVNVAVGEGGLIEKTRYAAIRTEVAMMEEDILKMKQGELQVSKEIEGTGGEGVSIIDTLREYSIDTTNPIQIAAGAKSIPEEGIDTEENYYIVEPSKVGMKSSRGNGTIEGKTIKDVFVVDSNHKVYYILGATLGGPPDRTEINIGDYITYEYDLVGTPYEVLASYSGNDADQTISQTQELKWRVLSKDEEGTVNIISAIPTNQQVTFKGALGYNNGVYLMNDICEEHYSNATLGTVARSINMEDIENQMKSIGKDATINAEGYGEDVIIEGENIYYPNRYTEEMAEHPLGRSEKGGQLISEEYSIVQNQLAVKNTFYVIANMPQPTTYFDDTSRELLFKNSHVASRCFKLVSKAFCLAVLNQYVFSHMEMFRADYTSYEGVTAECLRPIVPLGPSINIVAGQEEGENGTAANPWIISN